MIQANELVIGPVCVWMRRILQCSGERRRGRRRRAGVGVGGFSLFNNRRLQGLIGEQETVSSL